jgi:hypothetical protein
LRIITRRDFDHTLDYSVPFVGSTIGVSKFSILKIAETAISKSKCLVIARNSDLLVEYQKEEKIFKPLSKQAFRMLRNDGAACR